MDENEANPEKGPSRGGRKARRDQKNGNEHGPTGLQGE